MRGEARWGGAARLPHAACPTCAYIILYSRERARVAMAGCKGKWSNAKPGYYIKEQHGSTSECYDLPTAKLYCERSSDCHGIATQSNICNGKYRVSHGSTATLLPYANHAKYNMHVYSYTPCVGADHRISARTQHARTLMVIGDVDRRLQRPVYTQPRCSTGFFSTCFDQKAPVIPPRRAQLQHARHA